VLVRGINFDAVDDARLAFVADVLQHIVLDDNLEPLARLQQALLHGRDREPGPLEPRLFDLRLLLHVAEGPLGPSRCRGRAACRLQSFEDGNGPLVPECGDVPADRPVGVVRRLIELLIRVELGGRQGKNRLCVPLRDVGVERVASDDGQEHDLTGLLRRLDLRADEPAPLLLGQDVGEPFESPLQVLFVVAGRENLLQRVCKQAGTVNLRRGRERGEGVPGLVHVGFEFECDDALVDEPPERLDEGAFRVLHRSSHA